MTISRFTFISLIEFNKIINLNIDFINMINTYLKLKDYIPKQEDKQKE